MAWTRERRLRAAAARVVQYGKAKEWAAALSLLASVKAPDRGLLGAALVACERNAAWRAAARLLGDAARRRLPCDAVAYGTVAMACERTSHWRRSSRLLAGLAPEHLVPAFNTAMQGCSWRRAQELLWQLARQTPPDVISYNTVISSCASAHQWQLALLHFRRLLRQGPRPSAVSFSSAIAACSKGAQWVQAFALLQQSEAKNLLNDITLATCLSACVRAPVAWILR
ncbi:unnamed protein product [Effrenium voratum]|nr:unnamed protein product [Effrenium voratum]